MDDTEQGFIYEKPRQIRWLILGTALHLLFLTHSVIVIAYGLFIVFNHYNNAIDLLRQVCVYAAAYGTNWNFIFQTTFLSLAVTYDGLEWLDKHESSLAKKIRYARDVLFSGLVLPLSIFISTMFWTLFWIDRELVFPTVYDQIVPWWFNHCVHTNIVIVVVIETLLQPRRHPADQKIELILNGGVGVLYAIVYYSIYYFSHRWLYGVFGILTWWQICLYQILIWTSCFVFYFIQFPINRLFHKSDNAANIEVPTQEEVGTPDQNGTVPDKNDTLVVEKPNGVEKSVSSDFIVPPFSTKSWSLKYRSIRGQFENSRL